MSVFDRLQSAREVWVKCEGIMISLNQDEIHEIMDYIDNLKNQLTEEKQAYINMYNMYDEEKNKNERLNNRIENALAYNDDCIFSENLKEVLKGENKE